jgi:hypothetical protein
MSEMIDEVTNESDDIMDRDDINLLLASYLVLGLNSQPQIIDYFSNNDMGVFGCNWMKQHYTQVKWSYHNFRIRFSPDLLIYTLRRNSQKAWNLHQIIVTDEMIIPFTGRWNNVQHIKGKPHNTGLIN